MLFRSEKRSYAIAFSFPLVVGYRLLRSIFPKNTSKKKKHTREHTSYVLLPAPINRFFIALLKLEAVILERFNLPFGTSVFTIASRDSSALVTTELRLLAPVNARAARTQPAHVHTTRTS